VRFNVIYIVISYNIPLLTSQEEFDKIVEILEMERDCWNFASEFLFKNKKDIKTLHHGVYSKLRFQRPEIPAQVVIKAYKAAKAAYKSVKSNKHKITEPCLKNNFSIRLDKHLYKWMRVGEIIRFTTTGKRIDIKLKLFAKVKELFKKYEVCDPLIFLRGNRLFLNVTFENDIPVILDDSNCIGVDMGINNLLACSDGRIYKSKTYLAAKRKIRFLKSKLKSKGTKSAKRHLKKLRRKETNISKNFAHHLANQFISETKSQTIVFEDLKNLKLSSAKKNKNKGKLGKFINNKVAQVPISLFREIISYKAKLKGISVLLVDPAFTSQIDCRTKKKDGIRYKGRYLASDGKVLHSDLNASVNIAERAKIPHFLTTKEINRMIMGQGTVNCPIVCKSE
jgi:IS605 OrfB family transposase